MIAPLLHPCHPTVLGVSHHCVLQFSTVPVLLQASQSCLAKVLLVKILGKRKLAARRYSLVVRNCPRHAEVMNPHPRTLAGVSCPTGSRCFHRKLSKVCQVQSLPEMDEETVSSERRQNPTVAFCSALCVGYGQCTTVSFWGPQLAVGGSEDGLNSLETSCVCRPIFTEDKKAHQKMEEKTSQQWQPWFYNYNFPVHATTIPTLDT